MKKFYLLPALLLAACSHKAPSMILHLQELLDQKEYFKLDKALQSTAPDLPAVERTYFTAFTDNAFNENEACIAKVDSLLGTNAPPLGDATKANLLLLQGDSYFKLGQYAKAAIDDSLIIARYPKAVSKAILDDVMNELLIRKALKTTPAQHTVINANTTVHWTRDNIGLIEIPITSGGGNIAAIFDTRANISSITKTYADKLHLHPLDVSYQEGAGITGAQFQVGLAVADSVMIGNILITNAIFQVMPDTLLYIAPVKFQLNIILGFPVIAQLGEFQWYSDGNLTIPQTPGTSPLHNLALDGLDPVLALVAAGDTLPFHFDTGASSSVLYSAYFDKHKAAILKTAVKKTQTFGGAGGSRKKDSYVLPTLHLTLDNKTIAVDSVSVFQEKISPNEKLYGNIGQDFMRGFSKLTVNFRDMFVTGN
ncbi:MAG TPA: aspartyl protease family protein [Puia sp.]|nr:aspartyl protease family protein [Puia sp.]